MINKNKILVIDDDKAILDVVKIILEENKYQVATLGEGAEIVAKVKKINPILILLDIWLSGFDGYDLTQLLKNDPATAIIPIVMISANNETEKISKNAGADAFLLKPFNIDDLLTMVKQYTN